MFIFDRLFKRYIDQHLIQLDPECVYLLIVPNSVPQEDVILLAKQLPRGQFYIIQSDDVTLLELS